jgi:hypothetical protein
MLKPQWHPLPCVALLHHCQARRMVAGEADDGLDMRGLLSTSMAGSAGLSVASPYRMFATLLLCLQLRKCHISSPKSNPSEEDESMDGSIKSMGVGQGWVERASNLVRFYGGGTERTPQAPLPPPVPWSFWIW